MQIFSIRNKRFTIGSSTIINKITKCYVKFYANKFNNINKIDKFLENFSLPELVQDKI